MKCKNTRFYLFLTARFIRYFKYIWLLIAVDAMYLFTIQFHFEKSLVSGFHFELFFFYSAAKLYITFILSCPVCQVLEDVGCHKQHYVKHTSSNLQTRNFMHFLEVIWVSRQLDICTRKVFSKLKLALFLDFKQINITE